VAFAPDGATVFVAGTSEGNPPDLTNAVVLAYDTASGKQRWAVRWDGTGTEATASDLAIAPDGTSVVVVGRAVPAPMKDRYATAALDPATGAILWTDTFGITSSGDDNVRCEATSVAISRDGVVYVTGSAGAGTATVAYGRPR
jgi:outer membrane protein assembly factor BamB